MNPPAQPGGTNQMPHPAVSITGVVIKVEGVDVTTPERSVLPVTAKEKIREQMSLRELLKEFGKGWLSPYSSIGSIKWFFQDGTVISVGPPPVTLDKTVKVREFKDKDI